MKSFGLTGGIATGKSEVVKIMLKEDSSVVVFDADQCVHELYKSDVVLEELCKILGEEVVVDGKLARNVMREIVFADDFKKRELEDYIHPIVRKECLAMQQNALHTDRTSFFVADVPLLFESGYDFGQQANLVVATTRETQIKRLKMRSRLDDDTVYAILEAQLPISYKEKCADVVLWNEGPRSVLQAQVKRFIKEQIQ